MNLENIWDTIHKVTSLMEIVTFAFFVFTGAMIFTRSYRYRRRNTKVLQTGKRLQVALAVSLKPNENIKGHVDSFLKSGQMKMELFEIDAQGVSLATLPKLRRSFVAKKHEMMDCGVGEVHLFYEGPVSAALFLADVLNNWVPVYVYHFSREKGYECWGLLTESLERMATEDMVKEITLNA